MCRWEISGKNFKNSYFFSPVTMTRSCFVLADSHLFWCCKRGVINNKYSQQREIYQYLFLEIENKRKYMTLQEPLFLLNSPILSLRISMASEGTAFISTKCFYQQIIARHPKHRLHSMIRNRAGLGGNLPTARDKEVTNCRSSEAIMLSALNIRISKYSLIWIVSHSG
jgi:hypothetical protein